MSARNSTVGPSPLRNTPTRPWPPMPVVMLQSNSDSRSARYAAVASSTDDSSGLACRCRYTDCCQDRSAPWSAMTSGTVR